MQQFLDHTLSLPLPFLSPNLKAFIVQWTDFHLTYYESTPAHTLYYTHFLLVSVLPMSVKLNPHASVSIKKLLWLLIVGVTMCFHIHIHKKALQNIIVKCFVFLVCILQKVGEKKECVKVYVFNLPMSYGVHWQVISHPFLGVFEKFEKKKKIVEYMVINYIMSTCWDNKKWHTVLLD